MRMRWLSRTCINSILRLCLARFIVDLFELVRNQSGRPTGLMIDNGLMQAVLISWAVFFIIDIEVLVISVTKMDY